MGCRNRDGSRKAKNKSSNANPQKRAPFSMPKDGNNTHHEIGVFDRLPKAVLLDYDIAPYAFLIEEGSSHIRIQPKETPIE